MTLSSSTAAVAMDGYIGIDLGTQGLSVVFTDVSLKVLSTVQASYDFISDNDDGCYEQEASDWTAALQSAMEQLHQRLQDKQVDNINVLSIGISGQMHGEVLCGGGSREEDGSSSACCLAPVRLWCDTRNGDEGIELTQRFGCKIARRATVARFLWTIRNQPDLARQVHHLTTPAGWIAYELTGEFNLGVGDAAGMFPIDAETLEHDAYLLQVFDDIVNDTSMPSLGSILPTVRRAGQDAGRLTAAGALLMGLPEGIPVAPAEGDQVAALAGGLIGEPGMVSCSFGTSVCANTVGDHAFRGVSPAVDHFCAADGRPIFMIWLRNGTTFLNTLIKSYASAQLSEDGDETNEDKSTSTLFFASIMRQVVDAPDDCGGILALPFLDDEPGLDVAHGSNAMLLGLNPSNATPGNICKAALLCVMFNLRLGQQVLDEQGYLRTELNFSGGLCQTPACGQILANVFDAPVVLYESADEGCCWGAAILAKYCHDTQDMDWSTFLADIAETMPKQRFEPFADSVKVFDGMFERYKRLIALQPQLSEVVH
jgi:sugar (pentulose or hexulose) kinase